MLVSNYVAVNKVIKRQSKLQLPISKEKVINYYKKYTKWYM